MTDERMRDQLVNYEKRERMNENLIEWAQKKRCLTGRCCMKLRDVSKADETMKQAHVHRPIDN